MSFRIGHGFDAHALTPGRPLLLGGVRVPSERGLAGHSDGDCVLHALSDALLGAVAAGDIGERFPSSDERWRDADSTAFLREALRVVGARGFTLVNVDVTVIAETPRLAPHQSAIRERLQALLGLSADAVSVKAKSTDGLGALGRAEGIAALATALLERRAAASSGMGAE
jgi:2-C-methyl-D-erythritol 2,4-cyclodiphosphate synthase